MLFDDVMLFVLLCGVYLLSLPEHAYVHSATELTEVPLLLSPNPSQKMAQHA